MILLSYFELELCFSSLVFLVIFCPWNLSFSILILVFFIFLKFCVVVLMMMIVSNAVFVTFYFSRIHPVEWHESIGLRFNVIGCSTPSPTPSVSKITPSPGTTSTLTQTTLVTGTTAAPTACMYWTPWVNKNKPDASGEFESLWDMKSIVKFCDVHAVKAIECRTAGTHIDFNEVVGQKDVVCDLNNKGLLCQADQQSSGKCEDYEIRAYCDECVGLTMQPVTVIGVTTGMPHCTQDTWSAWINRDNPNTESMDHDFMTNQEQTAFCNGGMITMVECQDKYGTEYKSTGATVTCDVQNGVLCRNFDNEPIPCSDYKIRYFCNCGSKFLISSVHWN